ncbi:MAG TPA: COX15/CtaA family protein [Stellaceae bacterium]|nr:COX15/CtaA family protein [Stellaceae bacterium]
MAQPTANAPTRAASRDTWAVAAWLLVCCGMIFAMVVIGGITRLTWSGLSITEWQPVTGIVPPLSQADWQAEFAKYQQTSQYRLLNSGMSLADFKYIFLWEYVHRLWGRLIGFLYAVPLVYFLVRRQIPRRLTWPLVGIFLLGGAQGFLGWYMVKSGLVDRIEVSQYRLVAHLVLALAIYAATLWTALGLIAKPSPASRERRDQPRQRLVGEGQLGAVSGIRPLTPTLSPNGGEGVIIAPGWQRAAEALIVLIALTITAGGFVAGLNAGLTYNTFPLMDGSFVPAGYAQLQPFVRNWFENIPAVQFDHRLLAETTFIAVVLLWLAARHATLPRPARIALNALLAMAGLQFALGVSTLLLVVPIPLAAAHQAGAVLLLTAAIVFRRFAQFPYLGR